MAASQAWNYPNNSTLAAFKAWAGAIASAFAAFGWVQSSDSGQTAPSAAASVPAANAFVYQIWTAADSLAASLPIYAKIEYGTGTSTSYPNLALTVGTGSNGSGTLTNASARIVFGPYQQGSSTALYPMFFSGSASRFAMLAWTNPNGLATVGGAFCSIERSHSASGAETSSYITVLAAGYGGSTSQPPQQQVVLPTGALAQETNFCCPMTALASGALAPGAYLYAAPIFPMIYAVDYPLLGAVALVNGSMPEGTQFSYTLLGSAHTYVATNSLTGATGIGRVGVANGALAMRYE